MPVGLLPITTVKKEEEVYHSKHNDLITSAAIDSLKDTKGLPVGVQIAALPLKDEECLAAMSEIERVMKLKPFLSLSPLKTTSN